MTSSGTTTSSTLRTTWRVISRGVRVDETRAASMYVALRSASAVERTTRA
jgi:hypothetical protein